MASEARMPRREKLLLFGLSVATALAAMAACEPEAEAQPPLPAGTCWEPIEGRLHQIACPDISDLTTVDDVVYPLCVLEDCSDQPGQIGVWISPDDGQRWLSVGEYSLLIES